MREKIKIWVLLTITSAALTIAAGIVFQETSASALAKENHSTETVLAGSDASLQNGENSAGVSQNTQTGVNTAPNAGMWFEEETSEDTEAELSYIELYGLEEIDKPQSRTKKQVLEKLAELSETYELVKEVYENAEAYSDAMLDHLANNPEMAAYVLGSLTSDGSVTGGFTEEELNAEYPLILQFDPRWGYFEYGGKGMGISGCGPTSLSMAILYLTDLERLTPDKIAAYSLEHGYYVKNVGTAWKLLDDYPAIYGLTVEHPTLKETSMKKALDEGKVLVCSMKPGVFTAAGHFIVIYGYDETGFKVNDPMCVARSRRTWTFEEFGNQLKKIWAYGV